MMSGKQAWRCTTKGCKGRIYTLNDSSPEVIRPHTHAPDLAATKVRALVSDMKEKGATTRVTNQLIYPTATAAAVVK